MVTTQEGLDARVRKKEEAKLQELRLAIDDHKRAEKERVYAVRYHKVRFFERIKLERRIKKVEKQLAEAKEKGAEPPAALLECLACLQDDLQYVVHFPKGEKYVSILRDAEEPAAQAALIAERDRLRALVHKQQAEIAMVTEADEGAALLARQRRPVQQPITAHEAPADVPEGAAGEASGEEEDDFFTPDDSDRSASEGEHFHSVPRRSKQDATKQGLAQGAGRAAAIEHGGAPADRPSSGAAGGASAAPVAGQQREERAPVPVAAAADGEGDIADDDDFFLQSGASEPDSDSDGSSQQGANVAPGAPPVRPGADSQAGAPPRTQPAGVAQQTHAQRHTGAEQQRKGAPDSQGHTRQKKFRKAGSGGPAAKQVPRAQRAAGGAQRPKVAAAGKQRASFTAKPKAAGAAGAKRKADAAPSAATQPVRTRAEGGRKRRKAK
ncbi:hypothetical protein COCSUDRAFT_45805 [Coccomyxa subellipsoidea C-169]|uniref:rRNA-processing protein EFG1 n=1 Tax=Coccomyxa subellipsoidea (strain C-169) TaxID=574566 RepID=I0Z9H0_COCSC|nr:hypothetical protein COCSUDRAFT_45805 [Coccomyxa subellipsoidea C-169]EIE27289.1 hypothetical protein COCSUDRAFT_45805 [Coccomyxa subellipsoidea C-169]|eukprot:XP_005651833.1 hypothetical protein COCSUDRAFT_45805 [Coccomyxa subellipsoidea C-169]